MGFIMLLNASLFVVVVVRFIHNNKSIIIPRTPSLHIYPHPSFSARPKNPSKCNSTKWIHMAIKDRRRLVLLLELCKKY